MDGLLESFSRVTRVWCTMRQREEGARSCFDSFLFSLPPPPRFVVASLLVFLTRPLSSLTTTLDTLSLLSYPTRKGLLFKFERFFFFPSSPGKDTGYSSPPFNDYAAFWCGSNRYSRGWISHLISDVNIGGKWKFRVNTTLVDKGKFLSILSSRVISIPLFNIPSVNYSSVN